MENTKGTKGPCARQRSRLTIHFMYGYLSKNVHVWSVEHSAEYPGRAGIIRVEQCLIGHSIGHEPHSQKKKEEENVLHLREAKRDQRCCEVMFRPLSFQLYLLLSDLVQRLHDPFQWHVIIIEMKHIKVYWSHWCHFQYEACGMQKKKGAVGQAKVSMTDVFMECCMCTTCQP